MQKLALLIIAVSVAMGALASEDRRGRASPVSVSSSARGSQPVVLVREADGHFYADVDVNGETIRFLVDTGATTIALAHDDAERAGLELSPDRAEVIGKGAAGEIMGEAVTLDHVRLGTKELESASAVVIHGGDQSLLGQSFLAEFGSLSIENDTMVLR